MWFYTVHGAVAHAGRHTNRITPTAHAMSQVGHQMKQATGVLNTDTPPTCCKRSRTTYTAIQRVDSTVRGTSRGSAPEVLAATRTMPVLGWKRVFSDAARTRTVAASVDAYRTLKTSQKGPAPRYCRKCAACITNGYQTDWVTCVTCDIMV